MLGNMPKLNTFVLTGLIVGTLSLLLVGQRFNVRWAGGAGSHKPCPLTLVADKSVAETTTTLLHTATRGQIVTTESGVMAHYQDCQGTQIYLDGQTHIRLTDDATSDPQRGSQFEFIQGRIIVMGQAQVRTRQSLIQTSGTCEIVHYSWLDQVDVRPLALNHCRLGSATSLQPEVTSRFDTFTSTLISATPFNLATSTAKEFYAWVGL
jgi:hypothetical protein